MDFKKIKKSETTITGIVISVIITMGIFFGLFLYFQEQAENEGYTIDGKYNTTYNNLTTIQGDLSDNINKIQDNFNNIKEADSTYQVALNGLKGLGNIMLLPINFVSNAIETFIVIITPLDVIPEWAKTLINMALIITILLAIISGLAGGVNKI